MAKTPGATPGTRASKAESAEVAAADAEMDDADADAAGGAAEGGRLRSGHALRKKDLVDAVAKSTGAKKKVTKDVVDAVLAELSEAIGRGDDLVLPPLGRGRVMRQRGSEVGEVFVLRFRRGAAKAGAAEGEEGDADIAHEAVTEDAAT